MKLFKPYSVLDGLSKEEKIDYANSLSPHDTYTREMILNEGRLPGELWTPMHNICFGLYLLAIILMVVGAII